MRAEPLEHARRTAEEYETSGASTSGSVHGLSGIAPEETDTVVIAGMGGETIRDILRRRAMGARTAAHTLLLQPMTKVELLRALAAAENGYTCTRRTPGAGQGETVCDPVRHRWPLR